LAGRRGFLPWRVDVNDPRAGARISSLVLHAFILLLGFAISYLVITRMGMQMLVLAVVGVFIGSVYLIISFKSLLVPFTIWILSVGGFRYLWSIQTPLLPDLYLDRMMMIWLGLVFMLKLFASGMSLRKPFRLDWLIFAHGTYILVRVYLQDMEFIHPWTMSVLVPYGAYFFAKNIVTDMTKIRVFLWALLALTIYYYITAIAEKFSINALIFPKIILTEATRFAGRSVGPFLQAPLFGTIIGIMIPIHLYFIATVKSKFWRLSLVVSLALGFGGLYFTYTRGSWLAGVVALVVVAVLNRKQYLRILLPVMIAVPILAVGVLGASQDKFLKERVENENTLGSRVATGITALKVWRDSPVLGVGFFQYRKARENYIEPISVPGLGTIRFVQFRHNNIHDIYLGPLAEDGLLGMGMQIGIYLLIFRTFVRKYKWRTRGDPFALYIIPVLAGILAGYLVGGLAIDYRFFSFIGTLFYMSAGILEGYEPAENVNVS
jgi:O-antigen ligase